MAMYLRITPIYVSYGNILTNHANTVRWTYTVPDGKVAVLKNIHLAHTNNALVAVASCQNWVQVVDGANIVIIALIGNLATAQTNIFNIPCDITFNAGTVITGRTLQSVAGNTTYRNDAYFEELN